MAASRSHSDIERWAKKDIEEKKEILNSLQQDVKELKEAGMVEQKEGSANSVNDIESLVEAVEWIGRQMGQGEKWDEKIIEIEGTGNQSGPRNKEELKEALVGELEFNYMYLFVFEETLENLATTIADVENEPQHGNKKDVEKTLRDVAQKVDRAENMIEEEIETEKNIIGKRFENPEKVINEAENEGRKGAREFLGNS